MTDQPRLERRTLYDARQTEALLDALAADVAAMTRGKPLVTLVGVLRRGAPIAQMIARRLADDFGLPPALMLELKIQRYADDLTLLHPDTRLVEDSALQAHDLGGHTVVLVDDVLYRGHSLLRAVEWLERRQPAEIRTAVLVDRGVAALPVHADAAGARLRVADSDVIECHVPPYEPELAIELVRRSGTAQ